MNITTKKLKKQEILDLIKKSFSDQKNPPKPKDIKKLRKLAMSRNIKLKDYRKKFCKKCNILFDSKNCSIRIKHPLKLIKCKNCDNISRYKLK